MSREDGRQETRSQKITTPTNKSQVTGAMSNTGENDGDKRETHIIDSHLKIPLNACSLEVLQSSNYILGDGNGDDHASHHYHPLVIGCYELNENNGGNDSRRGDDEQQGTSTCNSKSSSGSTRSGALLLHMMSPSMTASGITPSSTHLRFDEADQTLLTPSGILDGKWYQKPILKDDSSPSPSLCSEYVYATATASGSIDLYHLKNQFQNTIDKDNVILGGDSEGKEETEQAKKRQTNNQYILKKIASSLPTDDDTSSSGSSSSLSDEDHGLALSLAWDESSIFSEKEEQHLQRTTRIVSSFSKGTLAVYDINLSSAALSFSPSSPSPPSSKVSSSGIIKETHRWNAHTLFGCAAEVWTVCFASNQHYSTYSNTVISGGDDCIMKLWDLRTSSGSRNRAIHSIGQEEFGAGVTAVTYHPSLEHIFCCGSYDESIRIWDMRKMSSKEPLSRIDVGGGVWRIKWHPRDKGRILVGAMHGGCRVVDVPCLSDWHHSDNRDGDARSFDMHITKEFIEHESMAYGADWIYLEGHYEAAASCSFYDRQAFIWSTL